MYPLAVTNAFTILFVLCFPSFCFILTIILHDTPLPSWGG